MKQSKYQAASWKRARRIVAKVESHVGELFPRVGFIVTHLEALFCQRVDEGAGEGPITDGYKFSFGMEAGGYRMVGREE